MSKMMRRTMVMRMKISQLKREAKAVMTAMMMRMIRRNLKKEARKVARKEVMQEQLQVVMASKSANNNEYGARLFIIITRIKSH